MADANEDKQVMDQEKAWFGTRVNNNCNCNSNCL